MLACFFGYDQKIPFIGNVTAKIHCYFEQYRDALWEYVAYYIATLNNKETYVLWECMMYTHQTSDDLKTNFWCGAKKYVLPTKL